MKNLIDVNNSIQKFHSYLEKINNKYKYARFNALDLILKVLELNPSGNSRKEFYSIVD